MSFSENLKQIRKERHMSQEELAELLDVSRQAVSKWEQGMGYPETEKLLLLSKELNVSLDTLMFDKNNESTDCSGANPAAEPRAIVITSPHENAIVTCYKVISTAKMKGGKKSPQYALFGVGSGGSAYWGEPTTFLGWYASEEMISREINEIHRAISQGIPMYTLQYSAKTERRFASVKIIEE
jgi:transcriptional regulator with XRE-family HTH domain